jgi:hypothetical protein
MSKQILNEEFRRMQKLAGINENEMNEFNEWSYNNDHGVDIVFKFSPSDPNEMLTQYDEEYLDPNDPESNNFTKASFWESDIINQYDKIPQGYYDEGGVTYASKLSNGTWMFTWDSGEISGFKEGLDFKFIPKEELQSNK